MKRSTEIRPGTRVLFRAPAGAKRGFGHLVRCISLARAMGVRPLIAIRGSRQAMQVGLALGADVLPSASVRTIASLGADVVVIDDPSAAAAQRWITAARRAGARVVTVHDLGLGAPEGDIVIDGSITKTARGKNVSLTGTRFAILDAQYSELAASGAPGQGSADKKQVLIALGGGPHASIAAAIARAIVASEPSAHVRIAGGFVAEPRSIAERVTWVTARRGLGPELASADVAVVGGGVSLYEACAMGVPAIALPVAVGQVPTVQAFAEKGAAIGLDRRTTTETAAAEVVALLNNPRQQAAMRRRSMRLVDGLGATRAAAAVAALSTSQRN
jgi:spore coat polysaccharide biosynthesis predicted glycosyltransferase SpsG